MSEVSKKKRGMQPRPEIRRANEAGERARKSIGTGQSEIGSTSDVYFKKRIVGCTANREQRIIL